LEIGLKYCTKITSKIHCIGRILRPHPQLPRRPEAGTSRTRRGDGRLSPGWQEGGSTPSATICVSPGQHRTEQRCVNRRVAGGAGSRRGSMQPLKRRPVRTSAGSSMLERHGSRRLRDSPGRHGMKNRRDDRRVHGGAVSRQGNGQGYL